MPMHLSSWPAPAAFDGSDIDWSLERLHMLAFVAGVLLKGDGSVYYTKQTRPSKEGRIKMRVPRIELKIKSEGFLDAFNIGLPVVLRRNEVKISSPNGEGHRMVRYTSKDFVSWCGAWDRPKSSEPRELSHLTTFGEDSIALSTSARFALRE